MKNSTFAKRLFLFVFLAALVCTLFSFPAAAADDTPVIALTYVPAFGCKDSFEGVVFTEDGGSFDPSDYRISLYVQLTAWNTYFPKPTYNEPYADIGEDGSFSVRYATGGSETADAVIHVMLIPASHTPTSDFAATRAKAFDYLTVIRTPDGQVTVSPDRELPALPAQERKSAGIAADGRRMAVNVGFYTDGSAPGSPLTEELIVKQLAAVSGFADTVRIYGSAGELEKAYPIAYDMGFSVIGTAWLSGDDAADKAELDALISHCSSGLARIACVGSETLLRGDLTVQELIDDIRYVRERLTDDSIPVTTAESIGFLLEEPSLRAACDILMPNCYPYWSGVSIDGAAEDFARSISSLQAKAGGKEIVVSETGWPTAGQSVGQADAGESEASRYFEEIRAWSIASGIPVLWFDAADEPWKASEEGAGGAHWGFLTKDFRLKDGYAETEFFRSVYGTEGFSNFVKVNSYVSGQFSDVPGAAWFHDSVVSAYEHGLMIGTSSDSFAPNAQISVAEVITLACRIHDLFYGLPTVHPSQSVWYDGYAEHAVSEGIIRRSQFDDVTRPATRTEVALILASALPETAFSPIKTDVSIPDVSSGADYYETVLMLYRAGILVGSTGGYFEPERQITRAEIAAIAARITDRDLRIGD